ncbi:MAG: glycosyltransferase [Candidatus Micrarchaeia archaeon]|jgi:1,2-diacylglycerol 3-alpha-glucosyltransferase
MKIAFFSDTYFPNVDGVVNSMANYRGELEKRGNQVYVFASGDKQAKIHNLDKHVYFYDSVAFPPYPQYKIAMFPFTSTLDVRKIGKIKLIHSHAIASMGFAAIGASKALKIPLVGTFHTMIPIAAKAYAKPGWAKKIVSGIAWKAVSTFYKPFDLVTAPTAVIARLMSQHGVKNVAVVSNGIDINRFNPKVDPRPVRTMLGISPKTKVVLVAGRLSFEKNVDVLVQAAKHMKESRKCPPDFKFIITGEGPAKSYCERLAKSHGLEKEVIFTGFLRSFELPFYYAACDVFATASTFETQGMALLEAMATGKPGVAANSLALPEAIREGENGHLFTPFDAEDCAQKICSLMRLTESGRKKFAKSARETAEEYSIPKSTDALLDAYAKVL